MHAMLLALALAAHVKTHDVHVTIVSDTPSVELERISGFALDEGGYEVTERVCTAPCDETVRANDVTEFYIAGAGVARSAAFDLSGYGENVTLRVKAGSESRRSRGLVSLLGGIGMMVFGGALAGFQVAIPPPRAGTSAVTVHQAFLDGGLIVAGVGLVLTVLGCVLLPGTATEVGVLRG